MMQNFRISIFILMLLPSAWLFGQSDSSRVRFAAVAVSGCQRISQAEIAALLPPGDYSRAQWQQAMASVLETYRRRGFYKTRLSIRQNADSLTVAVHEGPQMILGDIVLAGLDSVNQQWISSQLDFRGREYASDAMNSNMERLLQLLENNGYPFATIALDSLSVSAGNDSLHELVIGYVHVDRGPRVTIDSLIIHGNEMTRPDVILRESRLKKGQLYDQRQVSRLPSRLNKTGFFSSVEEPQLYLDDYGRGQLVVRVKEGNPNQLNAVFGYNPKTTSNSSGYITGMIDIAFKNLLGTGRVMEAYWRKKDQRSQELRLRYVEPWIKGWPVHVGAGFQQVIQDTTFIRRTTSLDLEAPYSDVLTIFSSVGREEILPDSMGRVLYQLPESHSWQANIGFSYDTRDAPGNPSRGVLYKTVFEFARKRVVANAENPLSPGEKNNFRRDRWMIDLEIYAPALKYQTILLGLHGRHVKSTEPVIPISDLFRVGGANSLRGFREDEFLGDQVVWLNLEYRYLLAARSRVFAFFDSGYFNRTDMNGTMIKDYKFGYGMGVRIETRLGIIGIDYGLSQGRGLTSGLVHIGLTNQF